MAAQTVATNSSTAKPVLDTQRSCSCQDTRGQQRDDAIVPGCRWPLSSGCVSDVVLAPATPKGIPKLTGWVGYGVSLPSAGDANKSARRRGCARASQSPAGRHSVWSQSRGRLSGCPVRQAQPMPVPTVTRRQTSDAPAGARSALGGRQHCSLRASPGGFPGPGPRRRPQHHAGGPRRRRSRSGTAASRPARRRAEGCFPFINFAAGDPGVAARPSA